MSITETSPAPVDLDTKVPLSLNQEFLCVFDQGDTQGPFGPRYHIVHGWRVRGAVDLDALRGALDDVVARHESLRTSMVRGDGERYQTVFPPSSPELELRDLSGVEPAARGARIEELLIEVEAGEFSVNELPHLRAVLGRFDDRDAVLVLVAHHTATDGWSMRLIIRDLAARYAARTGHAGHDLPPARQYREFAVWQREAFVDPAQGPARAYWREKLSGGQTFAMPTDRPRSVAAGLPPTTAMYRFEIGAELITPALKMARVMRGSPFMVLLAAFNVAVHRMTGATDVAVPTFTPGRGGELFQDTVGSFFNFLPLRTDIAGCRTYRDVANRTRATCIEGYAHDVPQILAEAPEFMMPAMQDNLAPAVFQVFPYPFLLDGDRIGDLEYSEVRRRLVSQQLASDIPDGGLWTLNLDTTGDVIGAVAYKSALFDEGTIREWVTQFRTALHTLVTAPDAEVDLT
jgi:hypothetical protein